MKIKHSKNNSLRHSKSSPMRGIWNTKLHFKKISERIWTNGLMMQLTNFEKKWKQIPVDAYKSE